MRVTIYFKNGYSIDIRKAYNIEYIDYYDEREVWIHYVHEYIGNLNEDYIAKYKENDIEQIKVRMG